MSEGQHFEVPPKSHDPQSIENLLEHGEIESAKDLEGSWGMQLVKIKNDGDALFRPDKETDFMFEAKGIEAKRSDLELMAYQVDKILGFNLVPEVVKRSGFDGSLQRRIHDFQRLSVHMLHWFLETKIEPKEIQRAAIFDHLFDVKDRHVGNFLLDANNKLWLIDHDFYMFFGEVDKGKIFSEVANTRELLGLVDSDKEAINNFLKQIGVLLISAKPEVVKILKRAKDRAENLLNTGQIPT